MRFGDFGIDCTCSPSRTRVQPANPFDDPCTVECCPQFSVSALRRANLLLRVCEDSLATRPGSHEARSPIERFAMLTLCLRPIHLPTLAEAPALRSNGLHLPHRSCIAWHFRVLADLRANARAYSHLSSLSPLLRTSPHWARPGSPRPRIIHESPPIPTHSSPPIPLTPFHRGALSDPLLTAQGRSYWTRTAFRNARANSK